MALVLPAVLGVVFLVLPLVGLLQRAPWSSLWRELRAPEARTALRLSLEVSLGAVVVATLFGVPLAWVLARTEFRGRALVRAVALLPMVLPPVVGGVALLLAFGRHGIAGGLLDRLLGVRLPFTTAGAVVAEAFVGMPFLVVATEAGLRSADRRYEDAAASLGAGPWRTFRRVTLPLVAPSLAAGASLCWARALGEFGATITFNGSLRGRTETLPLAIYRGFETSPGSAVALSVVLMAVSLAVVLALRGRWFPASR